MPAIFIRIYPLLHKPESAYQHDANRSSPVWSDYWFYEYKIKNIDKSGNYEIPQMRDKTESLVQVRREYWNYQISNWRILRVHEREKCIWFCEDVNTINVSALQERSPIGTTDSVVHSLGTVPEDWPYFRSCSWNSFSWFFHLFTKFTGGIERKSIAEILPDQVSFSNTAPAIYSQKFRSEWPEAVCQELLFFLSSDN